MTVVKKAYAKINLYLDVVGKREDGYHDLVTVMQSVSLADTLCVSSFEGDGVFLTDDSGLPTDEENLVVRAARAFFAESGKPFGVRVSLEKRIPIAAGLGGGSADAAAMLHALNELDGNRFSLRELARIGARVGADVPFCVMGGTCLCGGIGDLLERVENNLSPTLVLAVMGEGVSTPFAFGELDRLHQNFAEGRDPKGAQPLLDAMKKGELALAAPLFENLFEGAVIPLRPAVAQIKQCMYGKGALAAMMSGSGPSVWGMFEKKADALLAREALAEMGARAFVCEMIKAESL